MEVNGVIGTITMTEKSVVTDQHPIVTEAVELLADNGTLAQGTILALNASGTAQAYDPAATEGSPLLTPVGVLVYKVDTTRDTAGICLVHGIVLGGSLVTAAGAATDADMTALKAAMSIWTTK